jgi:hypothetical protein
MTVVLPTAADYRKSVRWSKASGMYQGATRTLESISVSDVLLHEFTHGLHHADQVMAGQRHAVWVVEGLASLFQRSTSRDLKITVQPGGDLGPFQETLRQGKAPALADLVAMGPAAFMEKAEACYPTARYLCFYLYRLDKLEAFYEAYKAGYAADRTGAAALEQVLGKPLAEIEKDWQAWVLAQEPPWTPARPPKAHLGVRMEAAEAGVRVTGFLRGSMAERAGALKIDDVILSVAGQATPAPQDLTAAVQSCRPGETVEIEILRRGERTTVRQMLGHVLE